MGIKDQMRKKRKKQELLDDLPDYEVLGLADDEIDLQPALDLLAQRNREDMRYRRLVYRRNENGEEQTEN